jgi:16S rRNA (cytosine967-C5)-methyltransferase
MTPSARLSAAIDILSTLNAARRPAADILKDWGHGHRFAGSADRAAIAGLVYDALRRRASAAWIMDDATPRATLLGMLALERGLGVDAISALCDGSNFAPKPLSDQERARLATPNLEHAPPWVAGDYPDWLDPAFARAFGEERPRELAALASRAPLDLRVNTLKADRDDVAAALAPLRPAPTRWSPVGLRIKLEAAAKSPMIHAEPAFIKGHIELQDEGSQLAALLSGAQAGEQVVDLCAGAGGKALALAALMANRGQIYATDTDRGRLAAIHARLTRAGARNVQVRTPGGEADVLADLAGHAHLVMIDAPCSGTGAWRRHPDAKWRMRPGALEIRRREQGAVLNRAAPLVRAGGRIVYVTCSVIDEENDIQVGSFLERHHEFSIVSPAAMVGALGERGAVFRRAVRLSQHGLLMTPRQTDTDGFFVAMLKRIAEAGSRFPRRPGTQ